jgi:predicted nucleotidyltransferase
MDRNLSSNVHLFGSMAKGVATSASDLDLLVDLAPGRDLFFFLTTIRKI